MKHYVITLLAATLIVVGCGCKSSKKSVAGGQYPLVGTQWNLVAIDGEKISSDFALRPFITFDTAGGVQGNLGCNSFFGEYTVSKKHKMTLGYQGSTKRLCSQMDIEKQFMKALKSEITRYEIKGDELIIFADNKEVMRFSGVDLSKVE